MEDIKSHPGYRYAFVNFYKPEDAARAVRSLDGKEMPELTGDRPLLIKFRDDKRPLGPMNDVIIQNEMSGAPLTPGTLSSKPSSGYGAIEADDTFSSDALSISPVVRIGNLLPAVNSAVVRSRL